ncbi:hypothetical protein GJ496_007564 [Pomphorhynchus laevis]|nr:hypothetical protein GJ496_007564 [Pomphorhynchus laevis]
MINCSNILRRSAICTLFLFVIIALYKFNQLDLMANNTYFEVANHELKLQVNELNIELQDAKLQINRLIRQVYGKEHDNFATVENPYFAEYELQRRSLGYNIDELRSYLDAELTRIEKYAKISLTITKDNVADRMRIIEIDLPNYAILCSHLKMREKVVVSQLEKYQWVPLHIYWLSIFLKL